MRQPPRPTLPLVRFVPLSIVERAISSSWLISQRQLRTVGYFLRWEIYSYAKTPLPADDQNNGRHHKTTNVCIKGRSHTRNSCWLRVLRRSSELFYVFSFKRDEFHFGLLQSLQMMSASLDLYPLSMPLHSSWSGKVLPMKFKRQIYAVHWQQLTVALHFMDKPIAPKQSFFSLMEGLFLTLKCS